MYQYFLAQTWVGAVRPPHEVLAHLLNDLEDLKAAHGAGRGSGSTVDLRATAPVGAPPNGAGAPEVVGAEEGPGQPGAGGGGKKEFVAETEAFVEWGRRTGELQRVPPLETVDLPGENKFTEGCLQVRDFFFFFLRLFPASVFCVVCSSVFATLLRIDPTPLCQAEERMSVSMKNEQVCAIPASF